MAQSRKILLIEPPFNRLFKPTYSLDRLPLALGYLAGAIRRGTGWQVQAYNADFAGTGEPIAVSYLAGRGFENYRRSLDDSSGPVWQEVRRALAEYGPDVVGISVKSQTFASARIVARLAKELSRETTVIVGGPHPSLAGPDMLDDADIDIAVRGEGEQTIVELLEAIDAGRELSNVRGIMFAGRGMVVETLPRGLIEDLDSLPFPAAGAEELLRDYSRYPATAFRNIFATRGCPYRCFFCGSHGIWGRKVRFRTPENVVAEIRKLQRRGLRFVHFDDDTFGVNRKYVAELCAAIAAGCPKLRWSCEIHVKLARPEVIAMMKKAGCYSIQLGVESGSDEMLRRIGKDIAIGEALLAADAIKRAGIELVAFFMVGFSDETEATLAETAAAMERIDADVLVYSIFTPYPGTEAYKVCRERGLIGDDFDVSLHYHQSPLNYFCPAIPRERFRELVGEIERLVDRRNARSRRRRLFSLTALRRARELGIRGALGKLARTLLGR